MQVLLDLGARGMWGHVQGLINRGCDVLSHIPPGPSLLHLACGSAPPAMCDLLLALGADVNLVDGQGRSPLIIACQAARHREDAGDVVGLLLQLDDPAQLAHRAQGKTAEQWARDVGAGPVADLVAAEVGGGGWGCLWRQR